MKRFAHIFTLTAVLLLFAACGTAEKPPENGTPEPPPLCGTYEGDCGELVFNGDGSSIEFELEADFAEAVGLPECGEGEYVFTFAHGEYRYDLAERMEITCGDDTALLLNKHGETCEDAIVLLHPETAEDVRFERSDANEQQK